MKPFWEQKSFRIIADWKPVATTVRWTKKIVLPGFDDLPLFDVLVFFINGIVEGQLAQRAASIAFNFFLALFPALLFFFTLIPYIPIHDFQPTLMAFLKMNLPESAYQTIFSTVSDILSKPRGGLLSFGILMALFFSTNGFKSIMAAFNMSYHRLESRGFWKTQLTAIWLVIITAVIMILSIVLIIISNFLLVFLVQKGILQKDATYYVILGAEMIIQLVMVFFVISFTYYFAPVTKNRFRFFSAGSSFATFLYILSYFGFNYYINNFSKYNALYGSIGTLIIFLMWIYFIANILLIGFELNISIQQGQKNRTLRNKRAAEKVLHEGF
jgi:membrane protein